MRQEKQYICRLWKRVAGSRQWETAETKLVNNIFAARLWANRKVAELGPVFCTRDTYHRDLGRADYVSINSTETRRNPEDGQLYPTFLDNVYPEVIIEPSVGELGYTP